MSLARPTILDRFRPVGAPGPSGPAGVPSADHEGTDAELLPVFAALKPDVDAARQQSEDAAGQARLLLAEAQRQADAEVSQARLDSGAVRARAAEEVTQQAAAREKELLTQAQNRAEQIRGAARGRIPRLAAEIAGSIVSEYLDGPGSHAGNPEHRTENL